MYRGATVFWSVWSVIVVGVAIMLTMTFIHDQTPTSQSDHVPFRGMYVSPYDISETGKYASIMTDPAKVEALTRFVQVHQIKSVSLYNLRRVLVDPDLAAKLAHLIRQLRRHGAEEVNAIGSRLLSFQSIGNYLSNHTAEEQFDGLLTEVEFWANPESDAQYAIDVQFSDFITLLQEIKELNLVARGKVLPVGIYIGNLIASTGVSALQKAAMLASLADRIYVHCYVNKVHKAYPKGRERLRLFANTGQSVQIIPIFSAEGKGYYLDIPFQGDYFASNGLGEGETMFQEAFAADSVMANSKVELAGFKYYEYRYMDHYLYTPADDNYRTG